MLRKLTYSYSLPPRMSRVLPTVPRVRAGEPILFIRRARVACKLCSLSLQHVLLSKALRVRNSCETVEKQGFQLLNYPPKMPTTSSINGPKSPKYTRLSPQTSPYCSYPALARATYSAHKRLSSRISAPFSFKLHGAARQPRQPSNSESQSTCRN